MESKKRKNSFFASYSVFAKERPYQAMLNNKKADKIFQDIQNYVIGKKRYKDPDFSAKELAEHMGVTQYYLSAVINSRMKDNFRGFLNNVRVKEAIMLMRNRKHWNKTIDEIGVLAGFSTRLTFYNAFKRFMNDTPKNYWNTLKTMQEKRRKKLQDNTNKFADLQVLRYKVPGFEKLTLNQKKLVYYLSEAAQSGRDILFDQNCKYNLRIRKTLESIYTHYHDELDNKDFKEFVVYLKRFWFSNGIHHHYSTDKIIPNFSAEFLVKQINKLPEELIPLKDGETLDDFCKLLVSVMFDPAVCAKRMNQAEGEDLIRTSAANYYENVSQQEVENYYRIMKGEGNESPIMYGLNSKLVKENNVLIEKVYFKDGLYGQAITKIIYWLRKAEAVAENPEQTAVISKLIEFYETGNLKTFDDYSIAWLNDTHSHIDFVNGFIETYGDPLGIKASWESIVNFKDTEATLRAETLSKNALWFEKHSPVNAIYKKKKVKGVFAKVITAAMLGGDLYPASAIGINLPNSNWIRAEHGSKSVTIGNLIDAYNENAQGNGFTDEYVLSNTERELLEKYGNVTDALHTDLHECVGHGSGKLRPGVDPDALLAYGATIEEARADLFALYFLPDKKLIDLKLLPNPEAYKAEYYRYLMNGLMTQLVRIELGKNVEEAHMRNRQLIAKWVYEQGKPQNVLELVVRNNKTYLQINDYERLRTLFGELLAEVQRIKSEGDYEAAMKLVETYGVKIDNKLHQEVLKRYTKLKIAPYKGFINPKYEPIFNKSNQIEDVRVTYSESYVEQMLRYSSQYATLPLIND